MFTNYRNKKQSTIKSKSGSALADAPGTIWVLFMILVFPAMCYASLFYRATLAFFATRDSAYKAAKSPTFTSTTNGGNNAQDNAANAFSTDMNAFTGMSGTESLTIVTQPIAGGNPTFSQTHLATVDQTVNVYFIKAVSTDVIQPLFNVGPSWLGMTIPGLTGPYNLTITAQVFVENPGGLKI